MTWPIAIVIACFVLLAAHLFRISVYEESIFAGTFAVVSFGIAVVIALGVLD